ncbi:PstS family phosphate ABC transporter substrate-binding protein [Pedobacter sp. SYSU D00535]|uniref:PstS family phosphate ABC transporter substrate-binding protein n=1 Tax=Pedobacter sp. SYSU D00535 TaxID=2810308 RepID=UPI001A97162F|nr:PstS family phosphate ABC transporter substrate-binding protein [Pedobacter sp. SYSU D00535]
MKKLILMLNILIVLAACGGKNNKTTSGGESGEVKIDGSSTVYPLSEAVAEEFRNEAPDVRVTVGESGTGGGFKKFSRGEIDINDASRPISSEEVEAMKQSGIDFIELPVAYDGLAVVVNKENDFVDYLTVEELKKLWEPAAQGKIKTWNQVRASFPNQPINLYGAGTASGTYDYFTEAIVGKAKSSRGDYNASEDDNVLVKGVSSDKNALGYFGLAYYQNNADKLKLIPIDDKDDSNGKGPILPTIETVSNGTYQPLARPEFIYVNAKSADRPAVKSFVEFYLKNAGELAKEVGSVALPAEVYELALKKFQNKKTGTVFGSGQNTVGVNMADLLKAEK